MIQRIQSLWLLIASIAFFTTLKLPFYTGNQLMNNTSVYAELNGMYNFLITVLSIALAVVSFLVIFLFKNRKLQLKLTVLLLLGAILQLVLIFYSVKKFIPEQGSYSISAVFYFIAPITLVLALRGIYKDEQLIKSVDRLR